MKLYYLTAAPFALSAIALRRLKISRFAELNDPFELLAVNVADPLHRQAFRSLKEELNKSKGLICFSAAWSNPVLWGHYAERHTGIALGFEVAEPNPAQAIYSEHPIEIPVDAATGKLILDEPLVERMLRTKFADWRYEDEWRVFVNLDHSTKESGMYFYDFSDVLRLTEVILGPRCELPIERVRALLASSTREVTVRKARIAFESFRVVEDRATPTGRGGA